MYSFSRLQVPQTPSTPLPGISSTSFYDQPFKINPHNQTPNVSQPIQTPYFSSISSFSTPNDTPCPSRKRPYPQDENIPPQSSSTKPRRPPTKRARKDKAVADPFINTTGEPKTHKRRPNMTEAEKLQHVLDAIHYVGWSLAAFLYFLGVLRECPENQHEHKE
jgi:hypothetical protein